MEQPIQQSTLPGGFKKSFLAGAIVCFSFPIVSGILHAMHYSSAVSGGAAVVAVLVLGGISGIILSIRISYFVIGLLLASIVWWAVLAIAADITVAMMSGTIFAVLAIVYGFAAFIVGRVVGYLTRRIVGMRR